MNIHDPITGAFRSQQNVTANGPLHDVISFKFESPENTTFHNTLGQITQPQEAHDLREFQNSVYMQNQNIYGDSDIRNVQSTSRIGAAHTSQSVQNVDGYQRHIQRTQRRRNQRSKT